MPKEYTWKAHSGHGGVTAELVSKRRKSGKYINIQYL